MSFALAVKLVILLLWIIHILQMNQLRTNTAHYIYAIWWLVGASALVFQYALGWLGILTPWFFLLSNLFASVCITISLVWLVKSISNQNDLQEYLHIPAIGTVGYGLDRND